MASWVITGSDRDAEGNIIGLRERQPDSPPAPAPVAQQAARPAADQQIAAFLPAAPAATAQAPAPPRPAGQLQRIAAALTIVALLALAAYAAWPAPTASPVPVAAAAPTAAPAPAGAPAAAQAPAPTGAPACQVLRAAPTYYAPAGAATGDAAERGQACALVGWHSGLPAWRQVRIAGGVPVWVAADRLSSTSTAGLVDLAPPPATQTPIVIIREVPVVVPPAFCTEQNASYRARRDPRGSEPPIGYAVAWSCESQADADTQAEAIFQQLLKARTP